MKVSSQIQAIALLGIVASLAIFAWAQQTREPSKLREQALKLSAEQNWKDALELRRLLLSDPAVPVPEAVADLIAAVEYLNRLQETQQIDALLAEALAAHGDDWRMRAEAARQLRAAPHFGIIIDQHFHRSPQTYRPEGRSIQTNDQDRQVALRWLTQALIAVGELPADTAVIESGTKATSASPDERASLWLNLFHTLLDGRQDRWAWRLLNQTPIDQHPDYLDFDTLSENPARYASVTDAGEPILWELPASWAEARNDAQRVRFALQQIATIAAEPAAAPPDESLKPELRRPTNESDNGVSVHRQAQFRWANFLHSQFSVDTLQEQMWFFVSHSDSDDQSDDANSKGDDAATAQGQPKDERAGILAIHTLGDDETIAKLASGVRRFSLPDELNPIRIFQQLAQAEGLHAEDSQSQLVSIYLNRRQYPKAAQMLQESIDRFGDRRNVKQSQRDNIVQARGAFDPVPAQTAGQNAKLRLLFRNATSAAFTARRVDLEKVIADTKGFYRNDANATQPAFGGNADHYPPPFGNPSQLFSESQLSKYVSPPVASWTMELQPRENHWDRRISVSTPLQQAGLYVVEASLDDGQHRARCLVWINDLAIVRKSLSEGQWIYVADALTGAPVPGANVEFFGYETKADQNRRQFVTQNFARKTDSLGQVIIAESSSKQWMIIARDAQGRMSVADAQHLWFSPLEVQSYARVKAYGVADQPVHRPGDLMRAKFWIGQASYAPESETTPMAGVQCQLKLHDPQGKVSWESTATSDSFGGFEVEVPLPESASLGVYAFEVVVGKKTIASNLRVRVEEFRKPEFEVVIEAPSRPVQLGDKIEAVIKAKYYFGSPVTDALVTAKVTRSAYVDNWYPHRPFDWCYGPGYGWFAYDAPWYPGWNRWSGSLMPRGSWWPRLGFEPPEIVLEQELTLDADGTAKLAIDTATAAQFFGDQDHKYEIEVEVRDASRRTLSAHGSVIASRQPFKIYSWLERGFYEVGQTVDAHFTAQTLDRRPVETSGKMELLRISYDAQRRPQEAVVESWDVKSDSEGKIAQRFTARRGGQYRLRARLKDEADHEVEGATLFTIRGDNEAGDNFRFSELELIPDKSEYVPGDTVQLQINADRADAMVLLFVRPSGGVVPQPKFIRLTNKSAKLEIAVVADDQPNFFVEAFTIINGRFYSAMREIIVPPANRVLQVAVQPDKQEYLPGEKGGIDVTVTDIDDRPVAGSVLLAVYDRALETIASDTLAGDIREFFWKWRRTHTPQNSENLSRVGYPIAIELVEMMSTLGMFGGSAADDADGLGISDFHAGGMAFGDSRGFGGGIGGGGGRPRGVPADMRMLSMDGIPYALASAVDGAEPVAASAPTAIRKDFADSALWMTRLECDSQGRAHADYSLPENLTDWQMQAWAVGPSLRVGSGKASAVTRKHVLVRLTTPRFLVQRDRVVLSAIVHNDFDTPQTLRVRLEIDGQTQLEMADESTAQQSVTVGPHQQVRVDWTCTALAEGEVTLRAIAEGAQESDAMQLKLPILVHGLLKTESWAGTVRSDQATGVVEVNVPAERRIDQSRMTVRVSPSLALAMVDALPYMVEYPYGCTEQTLNRFLPTVITQRVLTEMKVDLAQVQQRRNNLNAQELGDASERRKGWQRFDRNPVFDVKEVGQMVASGVEKLTGLQNQDGGWGWFSGVYDHSGPHTTATVMRGLLVAQKNDAAIVPDVLERGLAWLETYQTGELQKLDNAATKTQPFKANPDNSDALVFHTLVLADRRSAEMQTYLYEKREALSVYGKALLAIATHRLGDVEQTAMLRRNIEQFLVEDAENETAYLRDASPYWYWYGSEIEAAATYLKLLAEVEPKGSVAPRLVKYLLNNRKHSSYWNSTRDTALVVEAFGDYIKASGEGSSNVDAQIWLDGKRLGSLAFTPSTLFSADTTVEIAGNALPSGKHRLEIRRTGDGPLYYSAYLTNFTTEQEIAAAGLEVKIERRFWRMDPIRKDLELADQRGQALGAQRAAFDRVPVDELAGLPVGTLVEIELLIESKNDYEYLIIEDRKPAGLEPIAIQSGYQYEDGLAAYREMRTKHVAFFLRTLSRGTHSLRYQVRAEAPGKFTALPATIQAMYAPELVGNSTDEDMSIHDKGEN